MAGLGIESLVLACAVTLFSGLVKGVVGFAMPMIMISALAVFIPPEVALAALIFPTLVSNAWQAVRDGGAAILDAVGKHWRYLLILWLFIAGSAQLVFLLPKSAMFLILGVPVTLFAVLNLIGWRLTFPPEARRRVEFAVASFAGFVGGLSGVWGPPTVLYLTALETEKREQMRVQGLIYGSGAIMLFLSHIQSGVVTPATSALSALLVVPAVIGMWIGFRIQDRIDQALFRKLTLIVLIVAGLNLIRRGLVG